MSEETLLTKLQKEARAEQDRLARLHEHECYLDMANSSGNEGLCGMSWDGGFICWPPSPPGLLVYHPCPEYVIGFNKMHNVTRLCTSEGTWFVHPSTGQGWTNYSQCASSTLVEVTIRPPVIENNSLVEQYVPLIDSVSHVGYSISFATLVIAFCIFATFKRLRCPRNKLHMHLFVSFMLRAFTVLIKDTLFFKRTGLPSDFFFENGDWHFDHKNEIHWQCKMIVSLWQYFVMANYTWILMEGLYLHNLIFFAVFSDTSSIALYVILGWGMPTLFVVPWVFVRALLEDTYCWTVNEDSYNFQLILIPTTASILVNFILFINIVRVLLSKLKASISEEASRYRRWAKSTLVLVPLFGVHYTVWLLMYQLGVKSSSLELIWLFIDQSFASFQGFFVAVLYCLLNGEVRQELAKKWRRLSRQRRDHMPLRPIFSRRRLGYRPHPHVCNRGSTTESYMMTLVSSVQPENTSSVYSQHRKSVLLDSQDQEKPFSGSLRGRDIAAKGADCKHEPGAGLQRRPEMEGIATIRKKSSPDY